ncbi:hypothetical protein BH23GEM10_BH23GEM10_07190 [soil metagenome]
MIWQNPWAWLGLLTLAVPIAVHLLARHSARVQRFPSLRFLATSRLITMRRARPTDLLLLAVRLAICAIAVAALAQPYMLSRDRRARLGATASRVIVVDTSASMRSVLDSARALAQQLAGGSPTGAAIIIESASLPTALAGAAAWLRERPGEHGMTLISDMQRSSIHGRDLDAVPAHVGLVLHRIDVPAGTVTATPTVHEMARLAVRVTADSGSTAAVWTHNTDANARANESGLVVLHGAADSAVARATRSAALMDAVPPPARPIAVVLPGYAGRDALIASARSVDEPWMGDVVAAVHRDAALSAAASETAVTAAAAAAPWATVVRGPNGAPAIQAAAADLDGSAHLVLLVHVQAGTMTSVAAAAAAVRAAAATVATDPAELEPLALTDAQLDAWRRPASAAAAERAAAATLPPGGSDGRWLWLLVLALLGAETWLRRRAARSEARIEAHIEAPV